jgi:hypothetical protein
MKIVYFIVLTFTLFACNTYHENNLQPFQKIENYNGNTNLPVSERILPAPEIIVNSVNEMDRVDIYSSYELTDEEKQLFMDYYNLLPITYKTIIEEKVIGIYFINNFQGGGMTLSVFDKNDTMYMALFLNQKILYQTISEWINFRDNSVFNTTGGNISIVVNCNTNYFALLHILLHEASHLYDYYNYVTPFAEKFLKNDKTVFPTNFVKGIWNDYDEPIEEYNFSNRKNISFYDLGERLDKNHALDIFQELKNTPFNSLYGCKTWAEDFAETFTWYYLNKHFNVNYITTLLEDKKILIIYDPNENELVKRRYKVIEKILK